MLKKINIIGAGISGLFLGCCLKKNNFSVTIYEQDGDVSKYGAGLNLSKNATILLEKTDIGPLKTSFTSPSLVATFCMSSKEIIFFDCSLKAFASIDCVLPFKMIILSLKLYLAKSDFAMVS